MTVASSPNISEFTSLIGGRKDLPTDAYSYKLAGDGANAHFALDVLSETPPEISESEMWAWVCYASGQARDGVGDLLEVSGIDFSRHRKSPTALFDHGKQIVMPIGTVEDPKTGAYMSEVDNFNKTARDRVHFYQGKGLANVDRQKEYEHAIFCAQLFDLWAKRFIRGGSVGYQVIQAAHIPPDYATGTPQGLHLQKVRKLESSIVVMPANQDTVQKGLGGDRIREALCLGGVCGKPMSPHLVKSLTPFASPKKAQMGYEPRKHMGSNPNADHLETDHNHCGCGGGAEKVCTCNTKQAPVLVGSDALDESVNHRMKSVELHTEMDKFKEESTPVTHQKSDVLTAPKDRSIGAPPHYDNPMSNTKIPPPASRQRFLRPSMVKAMIKAGGTCDLCGKNPATHEVEEVGNPDTGTGHVCAGCADTLHRESQEYMAGRARKRPNAIHQHPPSGYAPNPHHTAAGVEAHIRTRKEPRPPPTPGHEQTTVKNPRRPSVKTLRALYKAMSQRRSAKIVGASSGTSPGEPGEEAWRVAQNKPKYEDPPHEHAPNAARREAAGRAAANKSKGFVGDLHWLKEEQTEVEHRKLDAAEAPRPFDVRRRYRRKKELDMSELAVGSKSLELRKMYRRGAKGMRRRVKSSREGRTVLYIRAKDMDECKAMAGRMGLKFEVAGWHKSGHVKARLFGADGPCDAVAKEFGRRVKGLDHQMPDRSWRERASISNETLANSPGGTEELFKEPEQKPSKAMPPHQVTTDRVGDPPVERHYVENVTTPDAHPQGPFKTREEAQAHADRRNAVPKTGTKGDFEASGAAEALREYRARKPKKKELETDEKAARPRANQTQTTRRPSPTARAGMPKVVDVQHGYLERISRSVSGTRGPDSTHVGEAQKVSDERMRHEVNRKKELTGLPEQTTTEEAVAQSVRNRRGKSLSELRKHYRVIGGR